MPCYEDIMVCAEVKFERDLIHNSDNVVRVTAECVPFEKNTGKLGRNHDHSCEKSWKRVGSARAAKQYMRHA